MNREQNTRSHERTNASEEEIARDAAAMGSTGISRNTGTGSAGSGLAASGDTPQDGTTGAATNQSDDLFDAAGPSGAQFGGTGTAGSGLGSPTNVGVPPEGGADSGTTGSDAASSNTAARTVGNRGTTGGGSSAGGGGR